MLPLQLNPILLQLSSTPTAVRRLDVAPRLRDSAAGPLPSSERGGEHRGLAVLPLFLELPESSPRRGEVRSALEAVQRRKIKTQYGSLATEAAIRNATHEALGSNALA